jgi:hypothetical protein
MIIAFSDVMILFNYFILIVVTTAIIGSIEPFFHTIIAPLLMVMVLLVLLVMRTI